MQSTQGAVFSSCVCLWYKRSPGHQLIPAGITLGFRKWPQRPYSRICSCEIITHSKGFFKQLFAEALDWDQFNVSVIYHAAKLQLWQRLHFHFICMLINKLQCHIRYEYSCRCFYSTKNKTLCSYFFFGMQMDIFKDTTRGLLVKKTADNVFFLNVVLKTVLVENLV